MIKQLLMSAFLVFTAVAQRYEPRFIYQAEIFTVSWNRWEHLEIPAVSDSTVVQDNTEVYKFDSNEVWEKWRVDYGRAHKEYWGWRYYDTIDVWYDATLSIPLKHRIEIRDNVLIYDMSPSHNIFASMDIRNEVSAFSSDDGFQTRYWRATRQAVGIRMNGLRSVKYRVRVGLVSIESVKDRSFGAERALGTPIDFSRVEIAGKRCDSGGGVWLEIDGGGLVTNITPFVSGEDYYRWSGFFMGASPAPIRQIKPY